MSQLLPTIIVSLILAGVVALAVRSLSGGHCNGDCGTCGGCGGHHTRCGPHAPK